MKTLRLPICFAALLCTSVFLSAEPLVSSGSFVVDRTPPEPPTLLAPADGASLTAAFLQLHVNAIDATSGVARYQFDVQTVVDDWQPDAVHTLWSPASDAYLWRARARDRAGNVSEWSPLFSVNFTNDPNADLDNDDLPDAWEAVHFASLSFTNGTADSDGDGLTDAEEFAAGTHPYEFYLDVHQGWNLLSMPFAPTTEGFADLATHGIYWRLDNNKFERGELPLAYEGFWLYAEQPADAVPVSGIPAEPTLSLLGGWNLIGPRDEMLMPDNPDLKLTYSWQGRRYRKLKGDQPLIPFRGYLTFAKRPTTLYLGQ